MAVGGSRRRWAPVAATGHLRREARLLARRRGIAACLALAAFALVGGAGTITANSTRDRTISFYNIHSKETLTVQYMKDGKRIPEAMDKINWIRATGVWTNRPTWTPT